MRLSVGSKVSSKLGGKVGKEDEAPPPPPPRLSVGSSHLFVAHRRIDLSSIKVLAISPWPLIFFFLHFFYTQENRLYSIKVFAVNPGASDCWVCCVFADIRETQRLVQLGTSGVFIYVFPYLYMCSLVHI